MYSIFHEYYNACWGKMGDSIQQSTKNFFYSIYSIYYQAITWDKRNIHSIMERFLFFFHSLFINSGIKIKKVKKKTFHKKFLKGEGQGGDKFMILISGISPLFVVVYSNTPTDYLQKKNKKILALGISLFSLKYFSIFSK